MIRNKEKLIENIRNNVRQIVYLQLQEGLFGTEVKSLPGEVVLIPLYIKNLKKIRAARGRGDSIGKEFFAHLGGGIGQSVTNMAKETGLLGTKSLGRLNLSKVGSGIVKGALPSVARAAMTVISPSAFSAARRDLPRINQFLKDRRSEEGKASLELAGKKISAAQERARSAAVTRAKAISDRNKGIISPPNDLSPYRLEGQVIPPKELSNTAPTEQPKPNPRGVALGKLISRTSSVPTGTIDPNTRRAGYTQTGIDPGSALIISNRYDTNRTKLGLKRAVVPDIRTGKNIQIGPLATSGRFRR